MTAGAALAIGPRGLSGRACLSVSTFRSARSMGRMALLFFFFIITTTIAPATPTTPMIPTEIPMAVVLGPEPASVVSPGFTELSEEELGEEGSVDDGGLLPPLPVVLGPGLGGFGLLVGAEGCGAGGFGPPPISVTVPGAMVPV